MIDKNLSKKPSGFLIGFWLPPLGIEKTFEEPPGSKKAQLRCAKKFDRQVELCEDRQRRSNKNPAGFFDFTHPKNHQKKRSSVQRVIAVFFVCVFKGVTHAGAPTVTPSKKLAF
jgi:hypothetical protein